MNREKIKKIAPGEIEAESFRIIEQEIGPHGFAPDEFAVVQRVIHATGDFAFARLMRFSPGAVAAGVAAEQAGRNVLVDVNMAAAGVSASLLAGFGGRVVCRLSDPEVAEEARNSGRTRSEVAVRRAMEDNIGIVAIGNAPTALLSVLEMAEQGWRPDLIVGVPVGFVNAAESKELLEESGLACITAQGRKGGTPVAVAAVNAIIRLAGR